MDKKTLADNLYGWRESCLQFAKECESGNYTDTEAAWMLLNDANRLIGQAMEELMNE